MIDNVKNIILGLLVVAVLFIGVQVSGLASNLGAGSGPAHYQMESFLQGVSAGARDQFSISNVGVLTSSGAVTLTGALSGTTGAFSGIISQTKSAFCFNLYATSTATQVQMTFDATAATTTSPFGNVKLTYGACN